MTRLGALAAIAALSILGMGGSAVAASCADAKTVLDGLKGQYGEVPAFSGTLANSDRPFTVTVNPKTGTWTLLIAGPPSEDGPTLCAGGSGDHWAIVPPTADAPKASPGSLPAAPSLLEHGLLRIAF